MVEDLGRMGIRESKLSRGHSGGFEKKGRMESNLSRGRGQSWKKREK